MAGAASHDITVLGSLENSLTCSQACSPVKSRGLSEIREIGQNWCQRKGYSEGNGSFWEMLGWRLIVGRGGYGPGAAART